MPDAHANFAYSLVATAPSPAASGTSLVVTAGQGTLFPAVPFNATICPVGVVPTSTNAEIVRVTVRATDTFTITRTQEGSSARTVVVGDQIAATITAKTLTDIESPATVTTHYHMIGIGTFETTVTTNRFYFAQIFLPYSVVTLTGIVIPCGSVASGNARVALMDSGGTVVASSGSTAVPGGYGKMFTPFSSPYSPAAAGVYYVGVIVDNSTATFITSGAFGSGGTTDPGSFTVPGSITAPGITGTSGDMPSLATY